MIYDIAVLRGSSVKAKRPCDGSSAGHRRWQCLGSRATKPTPRGPADAPPSRIPIRARARTSRVRSVEEAWRLRRADCALETNRPMFLDAARPHLSGSAPLIEPGTAQLQLWPQRLLKHGGSQSPSVASARREPESRPSERMWTLVACRREQCPRLRW